MIVMITMLLCHAVQLWSSIFAKTEQMHLVFKFLKTKLEKKIYNTYSTSEWHPYRTYP